MAAHTSFIKGKKRPIKTKKKKGKKKKKKKKKRLARSSRMVLEQNLDVACRKRRLIYT